jgi:hypothetical protein
MVADETVSSMAFGSVVLAKYVPAPGWVVRMVNR